MFFYSLGTYKNWYINSEEGFTFWPHRLLKYKMVAFHTLKVHCSFIMVMSYVVFTAIFPETQRFNRMFCMSGFVLFMMLQVYFTP